MKTSQNETGSVQKLENAELSLPKSISIQKEKNLIDSIYIFSDHSTSDDEDCEMEDIVGTEESEVERRTEDPSHAIRSVDVPNDGRFVTLGLSDTSSNGSLAPHAIARDSESQRQSHRGTPPLLPRGSSIPPSRPLPSSPSHQSQIVGYNIPFIFHN